ncbi:hypothetical protein RJ641_000790, partial [Dillenia turbinata]
MNCFVIEIEVTLEARSHLSSFGVMGQVKVIPMGIQWSLCKIPSSLKSQVIVWRLIENMAPPTVAFPSWKAVEEGVDLRSSKVCELGLLNYNAKHVLNPFEKKKFRCRYDYYWASVFEVEYIDHSSGEAVLALAEAPKEALPLTCRPISIYKDNFFNCEANDPSAIEMFKRYSVLSTRVLPSWFFSRRGRYWRWETAAGVVSGFFTSLISISLVRILQLLKPRLCQIFAMRTLPLAALKTHFKQGCFLVVYFSFVGWLAVQMLGVTLPSCDEEM